jgi:hypothetical protein
MISVSVSVSVSLLMSMLLWAAAAVLSPSVASRSGSSRSSGRVCGVRDLSSDETAWAEAARESALARLGSSFSTSSSSTSSSSSSSSAAVRIDVFFHVLTSSSGQGALSSAAIDSQLDVLNSAFSPHFEFVKQRVREVENSAWFSMRMGQASSEGAAKEALRQVLHSLTHSSLVSARRVCVCVYVSVCVSVCVQLLCDVCCVPNISFCTSCVQLTRVVTCRGMTSVALSCVLSIF